MPLRQENKALRAAKSQLYICPVEGFFVGGHVRTCEVSAAAILRVCAVNIGGYEVCFIREVGGRVKGFVIEV